MSKRTQLKRFRALMVALAVVVATNFAISVTLNSATQKSVVRPPEPPRPKSVVAKPEPPRPQSVVAKPEPPRP